MADSNYQGNVYSRNDEVMVKRPNWGAIWAGMFTFVAIWSVFGMLGVAIFGSPASPSAPAGVNVGMSIWAVILTIIAMFVAGRITGQLIGPTNSRVMHGIVMFGLSVTAIAVLMVAGGNALGTRLIELTHNHYLLGFFADFGWATFVALFLGWLAAIGGALSAGRELSHSGFQQHQVSHA